jgi:hypothetical protein
MKTLTNSFSTDKWAKFTFPQSIDSLLKISHNLVSFSWWSASVVNTVDISGIFPNG